MKNTYYLLLAAGLLALLGIVGLAWWGGNDPEPAQTSTETPQAIVWKAEGDNSSQGQVSPGGRATQIVSIGPTDRLRIEVQTGDPKVTVALHNPLGQNVLPSAESGGSTKIFDLKKNVTGGDWQIQISNPNQTSGTTYSVSVPEGQPPLSVSPTVNQSGTGQTIEVAITVQETVLSVTTPVSGAQVTAVITSPSGQTTTIILVEADPQNNPGVYSGNYSGQLENGIYDVEYVIDGENAAGQTFVQTTTGQFVVSASSTPSTSYQKKYDINRAGEVQIIGY